MDRALPFVELWFDRESDLAQPPWCVTVFRADGTQRLECRSGYVEAHMSAIREATSHHCQCFERRNDGRIPIAIPDDCRA